MPNGIRNQIDQKRMQNLSYNNPVLAEFETKFNSFSSFRKKKMLMENTFLASGGDPENSLSPANQNSTVDQITETLLNQYKEVKIAGDVYVILPNKDIKVTGGKPSVLSYIRAHGDIPRHASPVSEPENGLPKSLNPEPVDPTITVEPNAIQNVNCGGVEISPGEINSNRVFVSNKSGYDPNAQYYIDFGDGFVSYKNATEHIYTDGLPTHTVVVTVYNTYGVGCNPNGSGSTVNNTQGTTLSVSSINCLTVQFNASTTVVGLNEYSWTFDDGSGTQYTSTGAVTHIFTHSGYYNVVVNISHPDGTVSVASTFANVTTGSCNGGNPDVCDNLDREKSKWGTPDNNHKFQHRLRLKNFFLIESKLNASVNTYKKLPNGIWYASATESSFANVDGFVYTPDSNGDCGVQVLVDFSNIGDDPTAFRDATYIFDNTQTSLKENSVGSVGGAFGGSNTLAIKD